MTKHQKLHPTLSNLLPEGALRELIAQSLKVHVDNEFQILSYLGRTCPARWWPRPWSRKMYRTACYQRMAWQRQ